MTSGESSYLIMVVVVFLGFAASLAYSTHEYAAHAKRADQNKGH